MDTTYPETICPERFEFFSGGNPAAVPCCWNHPIDVPNDKIKRAVIVIHGVLRNADEYFPNMIAVVKHASLDKITLVVTPQFLLEEDVTRFGLANDVLFWEGETGEGWKKGDGSLLIESNLRKVCISSFEIVDRLIVELSRSDVFPNLEKIVVAGHSAGGQFVNRFAAGTQVESSIPTNIHLRFIVANPSTFLYFNGERRDGDISYEFAVPDSAEFDYDHYKYGLLELNPYMAVAGVDGIRENYPKKDVVYLLGGEDTCEEYLEQTPNAMLQGANRLERGQVYYHYLQHYFGERITNTHKIAIIPCVGHDNAAVFHSEAGIKFLFGV